MAESKITVARVKDKVGGREAEVSKLLYSDNGNIKTIGGDSAITVNSAKTLNGETKEQLLNNVNASTLGGKSLSQIQSRGKFGPIKLIMDARKHNPYYYTLLVTEDEELIFCGNQHSSMLLIKTGAEGTNPHTVIPHPLKGISRIKQVIGAWTTQYILYENGDLYGRGGNASYQLGINNTASQYDWVKITDNVDKLICESNSYKIGEGLVAVIKKDKSVWFWGKNDYGAAGMGNTTALTTPTKLVLTFLEAGDSVKDLVMNDCYYTSLFLITEKGKLYSCGLNGEGQLGLNDKTNRNTFTQVTTLQDKKVKKVDMLGSYYYTPLNSSDGYYNPIVLCEDGSVYSWCTKSIWGLGKPVSNSTKPVLLDDSYFPSGYKQAIDPIVDVSANCVGGFMAITKSGRLFVCGSSDSILPTRAVITEVKVPNEPNAKIRKIYYNTTAQNAWYFMAMLLVELNGKQYLYAFGENTTGGLGVNNNVDIKATEIQRVALDSDKVSQLKQLELIGTNEAMRTFFLLNNGQLWGCGSDSNCALRGSTAVANCSLPTLIL